MSKLIKCLIIGFEHRVIPSNNAGCLLCFSESAEHVHVYCLSMYDNPILVVNYIAGQRLCRS